MKHVFAKLTVFIITIAVLGALAFTFFNYEAIQRYVYFKGYTPSAEIEALANKAALNDNGREIFYFADPTIKSKSEFNAVCKFPDKSMVLGCYTGGDARIYILDVTEKKLEGVEVVTAAHEMLHAAYDDLNSSEKSKVDSLVESEVKNITDERILDLYASYKEESTDVALNEMHSIIATEVADISPELEEHYAQYFTDRSKVIAVHKAYRSVFIALEQQVNSIKSQLATLEENANEYKSDLEILDATITVKLDQVNSYAESGDAEKYYPALEEYKSLIADYNAKVQLLNDSIEQYNTLVGELNKIALIQTDLVHSLDSKYDEKSSSR